MKSAKMLADFTAYCYSHPDERFWQALRNWSGWGFVLVSDNLIEYAPENDKAPLDTFYWQDNKNPHG